MPTTNKQAEELALRLIRYLAQSLPILIKLKAEPFQKGCRALPAGVWGVPKTSFLLFLTFRLRRKVRKRRDFQGAMPLDKRKQTR